MTEKLDRKTVVKWWAYNVALKDYFISFHLNNMLPAYSTYFAHQGLEKTCKAYLIGLEASKYESETFQKAKVEINNLVKNKMGHGIKEMIKKLIACNVLDATILSNKYTSFRGFDITGSDIIEILEKVYEEARYPVPTPISEKYEIKNGIHWDPIRSSEPNFPSIDLNNYTRIMQSERCYLSSYYAEEYHL